MAESERIPVPHDAIKFLKDKLDVETDAWDDLKWGEHSHAFTVAHSVGAGVVDTIHGMLNRAMAEGQSFQAFKKGMWEMMEDKGWHGGNGHTKEEKGYVNWRIKTIFHTNMRTAYEAGRYRQHLRGASLRPILVYKSKLVGEHRREEHLAMHDLAFPYDDPFWDQNYPPNGWNCECTVVSKSVAGAERDGIKVLHSDANGNPPQVLKSDGTPVDWGKFAPSEWKYNPGRDALAPNFRNYTDLGGHKMADGRSALSHVVERYRNDMEGAKLTNGEFDTLIRRINSKEYTPSKNNPITYQVGNLETRCQRAMMDIGIQDSKIMATDWRLWHSIADKVDGNPSRRTGEATPDLKIPPDQQKLIYQILQSPERIVEQKKDNRSAQGRVFLFLKDTQDGKVIKITLEQRNAGTALQVSTMGKAIDTFRGERYEEIKW